MRSYWNRLHKSNPYEHDTNAQCKVVSAWQDCASHEREIHSNISTFGKPELHVKAVLLLGFLQCWVYKSSWLAAVLSKTELLNQAVFSNNYWMKSFTSCLY